MMSYTYISTPEKQLALLALLVKMREFCENSLKWKLFEPGSSTRDSGGEAICPHGWHSALGTHTSTILCPGEPLLFSDLGNLYSSLLLGTSTILFSATHLYYSLLCCALGTHTSTILCPALLPTSSLLCFTLATLPRAQLSPGTNLEQGSMLHWAAQERKGEGRKQFVQKERKHHNSVPVKTHFVHSPHQPTNFSSVNCLTDYKIFNIYSPGSEDLFNSSNRSHFFTVAYFSHTKQML